MTSGESDCGRPRIGRIVAGLCGCAVLYLVLVFYLASFFHGPQGISAALAAVVLCLVAIGGSTLWGSLFLRPDQVLWQVGIKMLVRMTLPLVVCMFVHFKVPPLADAGFVYWVLLFYLPAIFVDAGMASLALQQATSAKAG